MELFDILSFRNHLGDIVDDFRNLLAVAGMVVGWDLLFRKSNYIELSSTSS